MAVAAEERGIREAVQHYVDGMRTHKAADLKEGFHRGDTLRLPRRRPNRSADEAFSSWVGANPAPADTGEVFDCSILAIAVTGRVATATVRETSHEGSVIDHFHLMEDSGRSWILGKLWDAEPTA